MFEVQFLCWHANAHTITNDEPSTDDNGCADNLCCADASADDHTIDCADDAPKPRADTSAYDDTCTNTNFAHHKRQYCGCRERVVQRPDDRGCDVRRHQRLGYEQRDGWLPVFVFELHVLRLPQYTRLLRSDLHI